VNSRECLDMCLYVLDLVGPMTTAELAEELRVDRQKVYGVLDAYNERLVSKEVVPSQTCGRVARWTTV
jgi:sugar-specific transcriptional regulator TrmB